MSMTDPISLFATWFSDAGANEIHDHTACALATADASGRPGVRMVLLKAHGPRGFVFYTNLESPKAADLHSNPRAALCFHWPKLERQVRIEGVVERVDDHEADTYFTTRPRISQLGAWASRQSQPMSARFALASAIASVAARFPLGSVPRPPNWSGFRVVPNRIEFWVQRPFRHHDRERFTREDDTWRREWLFP